jgi:hypothetical protein
VEAAVVNGPDLKTENDFGSEKVKTENSTVDAGGSKLRCRFPAHSFTQIQGAPGLGNATA